MPIRGNPGSAAYPDPSYGSAFRVKMYGYSNVPGPQGFVYRDVPSDIKPYGQSSTVNLQPYMPLNSTQKANGVMRASKWFRKLLPTGTPLNIFAGAFPSRTTSTIAK